MKLILKVRPKKFPFIPTSRFYSSAAAAIIILLTTCAFSEGQSRLKPISADGAFTFAVLGDNRGDSSGNQSPIFYRILRELDKESPALVLNTGDLINGYKEDEEAGLRQMWRGYKTATSKLKMPVFNVPGNHDVFNQLSRNLWKEYMGASYYSFDYGRARFIALDTETERSRLSKEQFEWLEKQLAGATDKDIFIFLHQPLFPVDGHIGSSLDVYPQERDRLHELFVRHRKNIKGVFQGHEHLYSFEERDGVPYYITGGGGAELYVPPELGGFYHYLVVRVDSSGKVLTTMKRIRISPLVSRGVQRIPANSLLENWEHSLFWYTWKEPVSKELTKEYFTDGAQGIKVWLDYSLHEYPVLYAPLYAPLDLSLYDSLSWDVFVPQKLGNRISAVLSINEKYGAPPVLLKAGWNRVVTRLSSINLPEAERRGGGARQLQWTLHAKDKKLAGWVVFDNLRAHAKLSDSEIHKKFAGRRRRQQQLLESWEDEILWGASDETVRQEPATGLTFKGRKALKVGFDFSKYKRPAIFAAPGRPWDLTGVSTLTADVYAPPEVGDKLSLSFVINSKGVRYQSPEVSLRTGWNKVAFVLEESWLPLKARREAEQLEWHLSTRIQDLSGWVVFDDLRSGQAARANSKRLSVH